MGDRERDIDAAMQTAAECRLLASQVDQTKMFACYATWLKQNAKAAERWATKQ